MRQFEVYTTLVLLFGVVLKDTQTSLSCSLDVAYLMDSSGSIGTYNFNREKQFVKQSSSVLGIPDKSRASVIVFGRDARVAIDFSKALSLQHFKTLVDNIQYYHGSTRIDKALLLAAKDVFPKARVGAAKIAVMLTDGKQTVAPDSLPLMNASQPLRDLGVRVIAVGIGHNVDADELKQMVEFPDDVVLVKSFDELTRKVQDISQYLCNISMFTTTANPTTASKNPVTFDVDKWNITINSTSNNTSVDTDFSCDTGQNKLASTFIRNIHSLNHQDAFSLKNATGLLAQLIHQLQTQKRSFTGSDVMCCVQALEEFGFKFAGHFLSVSSRDSIELDTDCVAFHAKNVKRNTSEDYIFPSYDLSYHGAMAVLPKEIFRDQDIIVVSLLYKDLHVYLKEMSFNLTDKNLGTRVISLTMKPRAEYLSKNVILRFKPITGHYVNPECVFWSYSRLLNASSGWSPSGCSLVRSNSSFTECTCNHLTHFAVLMQIAENKISPTDQAVLSVITYTGVGISLLGCALTFILHFAFVNVKAQLSQIHINLVVAIGIGQIIFIAGIDATGNLIGCVFVAALIQYFYLVAFCWMLIEGVQLYLRIVKVFNVEHGMPASYVFAWGFPLVVVSATIGASATSSTGIAGFVHEKYCWLSFKSKIAWTFVGPVLVITMINVILLLHVIREMSRMDNAMVGSTPQLDIVRKTAKACAVLFPLLGITWVFGILTMSEVGVAAQYIFTILNSIQGFLIFLLNCVRNSEIRSKFKARFPSFYRSKTTPSTVGPNPSPPSHLRRPPMRSTAFTQTVRHIHK